MRLLHYATGTIVVGNEVARAIEEYALILARKQSADIIILPATQERDAIEILLGPSSQLFSEHADGPASDEQDDQILEDIRARQAGENSRAQPIYESDPVTSTFDDYDL